MPDVKITIILDKDILTEVDRLVRRRIFPSRNRAIREKMSRIAASRLADQCAKLDPKAEKALAEEGLSGRTTVAGCPSHDNSMAF